MYQSTWRSQVDSQTQCNSYKIAQNIQNKYKKHEKNSKAKTWQKRKSNTTSYTQPLLWDMKVECFDPAYWSMWLSIFSFQWMQELLLTCPVSRISMIDYVSVALTYAIWKPRYIPLCFLSLSFLRYSSYFFGSQYFRYSLWNFFLSIIFPDLFKVLLPVLFAVMYIFRRLCWSHFVSNEPALKIKQIL